MDDVYFTVYILTNHLKFEVVVKYGSNKYQKKITFRCKHIDGCNFFVRAFEQGGDIQVFHHEHSHPLTRMKNCLIINTLTDEIMNQVESMIANKKNSTPENDKVNLIADSK